MLGHQEVLAIFNQAVRVEGQSSRFWVIITAPAAPALCCLLSIDKIGKIHGSSSWCILALFNTHL